MNTPLSLRGISPSVLSADFSKLGREVQDVKEGGADAIHVDIMDGHFVPNITCGPMFVEAIRRSTDLPIDVHFMVTNAEIFIEDVIKAGADVVTVHVEACRYLHRCVSQIRELGAHPGVVLSPSTPLSTLDYILDYVDLVLLLGVEPGFGGQKYIGNVTRKIADLRKIIDQQGREVIIEVDGGVNPSTIAEIAAAGADLFVAGSAVFKPPDRKGAITELKRLISEGKGETIIA